MTRVRGWLAPPVPLARVALLRTVLALFVLYDMAYLVNDVVPHGSVPAEFYQPLLLRRLLDLPAPSPGYVRTEQVVLVVAALLVAAGLLPRLAGWVLALGFLDWVSIGMSYAKIDHDHFALVLALFLLPTVARPPPAAWRDGWRDARTSEAAGWALRGVQVGCVATYFLSAWAKMRFGGWGWANGAVFLWAMTRRGTDLGRWIAQWPWLLHVAQWGLLCVEAATPALLFLRLRLRLLFVALLVTFHLATWSTIRISFLPLVVCLLAFVPLEQLTPRRAGRAPAPAARAGEAAGTAAPRGA